VSDRDVTHSDLVEIAKRNGDFRRNYGVLVGAFLYLRSVSAARPRFVLVASPDGSSRGCVGLLVAMNYFRQHCEWMNRWPHPVG
jgi:hypothetical protein